MNLFFPLCSCLIFLCSAASLLSTQYSNDTNVGSDLLSIDVRGQENPPSLSNENKEKENESDGSWIEDAEYVAAAIASLAAVSACFKYRGRVSSRGGEGYEQIQSSYFREESEKSSLRTGTHDETISPLTRRPSSERISTQGQESLEMKKQRFKQEFERYCNQQIGPRNEMIDWALEQTPERHYQVFLSQPLEEKVQAVREKEKKFIELFKQNFKKNFQYEEQTRILGESCKYYSQALDNQVIATASSSEAGGLSMLISFGRKKDPLSEKHDKIMSQLKNYRLRFDQSWDEVFEATEKQYGFLLELEAKKQWISESFAPLVQDKIAEVEDALKEGPIGEMDKHRINAIQAFFQKAFRGQFDAKIRAITVRMEKGKGNLNQLYNYVEQELPFWESSSLARAAQNAENVVKDVDQETGELMQVYKTWLTEIQDMLEAAVQRYDAVNHIFPEKGISTEGRNLVISAVTTVNIKYALELFYYQKEHEQEYLQGWIQHQYNGIRAMFQKKRDPLSIDTYLSLIKGTLPENETQVLRYFIENLKQSSFGFIRAKAQILSEELDRAESNSDSK